MQEVKKCTIIPDHTPPLDSHSRTPHFGTHALNAPWPNTPSCLADGEERYYDTRPGGFIVVYASAGRKSYLRGSWRPPCGWLEKAGFDIIHHKERQLESIIIIIRHEARIIIVHTKITSSRLSSSYPTFITTIPQSINKQQSPL